ncbi:hypothetical protein FXB39_17295 [Nocardioides sp. BGMRC 2183]|nr:hypothetical protein FXB39_17295 [Nocardioides sp. BGMRC 2183]
MRLLLTSLSTLLLLALAPAAQAETWSHTDTSGDVHVVEYGDPPLEYYEPARKRGDITEVNAAFRAKRFLVEIDLRQGVKRDAILAMGLKGDTGRWHASLSYVGKHPHLQLDHWDQGWNNVFCPGLRAELLKGEDRGWISVPNNCLDKPRKLRFSLRVVTFTDDLNTNDEALREGGKGYREWYSPVLRRG